MGYLINAWNETQRKFDMNLKQIVNIAGDESLENADAVRELRDFFTLIDLQTMGRLIEECYSKEKKLKFDARGYAFQDLVNEMGRRLGYQVERGLYRGRKNEIGFDGLWKLDDGSSIIMESKATGAYAFDPGTVIHYRRGLINENRINETKSSILVVYGQDEKATLRNAVKGSDESPCIRLISATALFQLVKIVTETRDAIKVKQIHNLLKPKDYFVLDNLVELVFPETDLDIPDLPDPPVIQSLPPLPDMKLAVGMFIKTAMQNLASAKYVFSDEQMKNLCEKTWMHDTYGFTRNLPFLKIYDPNEPDGHKIEGNNRYYSETLVFGKYTVYLTKELYAKDKEQFIKWYASLTK